MISVVFEAAVRALALGVVVWLVLTLTRSRNAHLQKTIWTLVLFASVAMPFIMQAHVWPVVRAPEYFLMLRSGLTQHGGGSAGAPLVGEWVGLSIAVALLYSLVALVLLWRFGSNMVRMWLVRRDARVLDAHWAVESDIRVSSKMSSPATFGATIVLPAEFFEWSEDKKRAVIAHEGAHVRDKDGYVLWLARLHTCFFWFSPLAWWLQRQLTVLAETTSDEAALEVLGDRPSYASILLEFAKQRPVSSVATAMARANISARIEAIISGVRTSRPLTLWRRMLVVAAVLPLVTATAAPVQSAPAQAAPTQTTPTQPAPTQTGGVPTQAGEAAGVSVVSWPTPDVLMKYYPVDALHRGVHGVVKILVTLDKQGRATDTLILSEEPLDVGFGAAASALAHEMAYNNPTGQPAQLSFNVKFALND
jgi:hypothetical protein